MKKEFIKKNLLLLLIVSGFFCCKEASTPVAKEMTVFVDSEKNIKLSIPDSLKRIDWESASMVVAKFIDQSERFYLDTTSTLDLRASLLDSKAYELRKKLLEVLPKITLTTGLGEDKFSREYRIVEGDMKLNRDELLFYCKKRLQNPDTNVAERIESRKLTVAADRSGRASIWPTGTIIKYCIMRSSFSSKALYDTVVKNMDIATNDWMNTCNVKFEYLQDLDRESIDVETYPEPVIFVVKQINVNGEFIAQSFFPSDPTYERMLLVDNSFFNSSFSKPGVLRHELGHILGFRHEHIWSQEADCRGESIIQQELGAHPLTKYDPYSVMHYPCGINRNNRLLGLTDFDKEGALKVYPFNN